METRAGLELGWSWDEAGRTTKKERCTDPSQLILLAPGPACLSPPNIQTNLPDLTYQTLLFYPTQYVTTRPRSSSICLRRTQPSLSLVSLSHHLTSQDRKQRLVPPHRPSELRVDLSCLVVHFGERCPLFRVIEKSRPSPPQKRILQSRLPTCQKPSSTSTLPPSTLCPPPPRSPSAWCSASLGPTPCLSSAPVRVDLLFDPARSAWSLGLQQQLSRPPAADGEEHLHTPDRR